MVTPARSFRPPVRAPNLSTFCIPFCRPHGRRAPPTAGRRQGRTNDQHQPRRSGTRLRRGGVEGGGRKNRAGRKQARQHQQPSGRTPPLHDAPMEPAPPAGGGGTRLCARAAAARASEPARGSPQTDRDRAHDFPGGDAGGLGGRAQNPPRGATGRAPPTGAGRHAAPRSADFLRIPWRVWAPLPRIAARAPTRARSGATTGRAPPTGAGRHAAPPTNPPSLPPIGRHSRGRRKVASRSEPPGRPAPNATASTPDSLSYAADNHQPGGLYGAKRNSAPTLSTSPTPRRVGGARGGRFCRAGCGAAAPRASRGEPPKASEPARAISPDDATAPSYLILGHYYFTTL